MLSNLSTDQVLGAFADEIALHGGRVTDTFNDGRRLWTRSLLARTDHVRPGDQVQGGVALKANDEELRVYPYVFREICSNGAIIAQTIGSRAVVQPEFNAPEFDEPETVLASIREAVAACCAAEVFEGNVRGMRASIDARADRAITMLPLVARAFSRIGGSEILARIVEQFYRDEDRSQYGLANAITAVARETHDPEQRWNLEELGGGIAVGIMPKRPSDRGRAARGFAAAGWGEVGPLEAIAATTHLTTARR